MATPHGAAPTAHRLAAALTSLNGLHRLSLQRLLFQTWQHPADAAHHRTRALAEALVHLRRTDHETYTVRDHLTHTARETTAASDLTTAAAPHAALPLHTTVRILGEPHHGVIRHIIWAIDISDICPAPWYLVAVEALRLCRAHGADEIEALAEPASARTTGGPPHPEGPRTDRHPPDRAPQARTAGADTSTDTRGEGSTAL